MEKMSSTTPEVSREMQVIIAIVIAILLCFCAVYFAVRCKRETNPRSKKWDEALAIVMVIGTLAAILTAYYSCN